jgi:hypothetical protein
MGVNVVRNRTLEEEVRYLSKELARLNEAVSAVKSEMADLVETYGFFFPQNHFFLTFELNFKQAWH